MGEFMEDVEQMSSSPVWLKTHGLKECKLCLSQIIKQISFRHSEDYVQSLRKSVASQYGEGLFPQFNKDGSCYNLTATPERLQELCFLLEEKAQLYHCRRAWLTTGSRQVFGVIQEEAVSLVVDLGGGIGSQDQLGKDAVCRVLKEQVSRVAKFNLICSGISVRSWMRRAVAASEYHLRAAERWLRGLAPEPSCPASTTAALQRAMEEPTIQAVYLFVVGDFKGSVTDVLRYRPPGNMKPVHTVLFRSKDEETVAALRELSQLTAGRFHAYTGMRGGEGEPLVSAERRRSSEPAPQPAGHPPGGIREDVYLVWWERQEAIRARDVVLDIQRQAFADQTHPDSMCPDVCSPVESLSSREWLSRFGLIPQKLDVFGALGDCAFRHSDGVVDVKCQLTNETTQSDAGRRKMLVNAKYCEGFAHMKWRDDSLVHVYVPAEKLRWYEERMAAFLQNVGRRLTWLRNGSRDLFGTVLEDHLYLLIDTSESMRDQLPLLKDKIQQLIKEQLCHKSKINVVAFGSRVACWRSRLTDVNSHSLDSVCWWVKGLQAAGSTNTLEALGQAFTDRDLQAVYLLTDGRPDQPIGSILEQVRRWGPTSIPVHTISFNCDDQEANDFLLHLARETQGRFHCYHPATQGSPLPQHNESEDIHLLKREMKRGEAGLRRVRSLRAECVMLDAFHHESRREINRGRSRQKGNSAPTWQKSTQHQKEEPLRSAVERPHSERCQPKPEEHEGQTGAGMLGLVSSGLGRSDQDPTLTDRPPSPTQDWMLSETQLLLQRNAEKQEQVLQKLRLGSSDGETTNQERIKPRQSLDVPSAEWLKSNSLEARRLTFTEAVTPYSILHTPKHLPLLDKQVYSKVFDEACPLLHISLGSEQHLAVINPLALNLEGYKIKLQKVLSAYERRLNRTVWRCLTQEEKDQFGGVEPVSFRVHRSPLLEALERLGWPLALEDVTLLEEEIHMGVSFLQQASDLQRAAQERRSHHANARRDTNSSSNTPVRKASQRPPDPLRGQRVIARSEIDGYYYSGMVKACVRRRAVVQFTSGGSEIVPLEFLFLVGGAQPCPRLTMGDFVLVADKHSGGRFLPGVVIATPCRLERADRFFSVLQPDGEKVHCQRIRMVKISQRRYLQTCMDLQQHVLSAQSRSHSEPPSSQRPSNTSSSADSVAAEGGNVSCMKTQRKARKQENTPEEEGSKQEVHGLCSDPAFQKAAEGRN
ncbi:von Willebrand factor A domain-containing protein 3B-like isoform X2 [Hypomesus transpacificus]|uniref:von Willebrand factor A domain-containing protein 3B-like isoform X2 n=1 Tax=Hypomesus transpacificus TaxID=137520 RepID=UPI001F085459|nr:von Willebrand factor A domain-containing protein 3B-like isoform X2 [Hypomesus transpacificus]